MLNNAPKPQKFVKGQTLDSELVKATAGVLSREEWVAKTREVQQRQEAARLQAQEQKEQKEGKERKKRKREKENKKKSLSFADPDEEDGEGGSDDAAAPATKVTRVETAAPTPSNDDPDCEAPTYLGNAPKDIAKRNKALAEELAADKLRCSEKPVEVRLSSAGRQGGKTHTVKATQGTTVDAVLSQVYNADKALATAFSSHDCMLFCGNVILPATLDIYDILAARDAAGKPMFNPSNNTLRVILRRLYLSKEDSKMCDFLTYDANTTFEKVQRGLWRVARSPP